MKAALLISHGSHSSQTEDEIKQLVLKLKQKLQLPIVEYAFLEITKPTILEGIENCIKGGATHITVLLNFLNSGKHVTEDIPQIIREARLKHPSVTIESTNPIGQHKNISDLFLDFIK